jgi:signal transduction histidine kinase
VREDERKHLADEIHDKFSTSLSIITRRMKNIRDNIVDEESVKEIDAILFITEDARNFVRKMISEIGSDIVRDLGIVSAVKNYTQVFSKNNNIKVNLLLENDLQLNPDVANVIYRIMQESLNNIACHAQADNVSINLRKTNDKLVCCIADNGIGISQQAIDSNETYGLLSMKQRTKNLGGTFLIRGKKRSGTTIDISIPLTSKIIL